LNSQGLNFPGYALSIALYGLSLNKIANIPRSEFSLNVFWDKFRLTSSSLHFNFSSISHIVASLAVSIFQKFFGTFENSQDLNFPGYAFSIAKYGLPLNKTSNILTSELSLNVFLDKFRLTSSSLHFNFSSISHIVASLAVSIFQIFFCTDGNSQGLNFPGYAFSIARYGLLLNKIVNIPPSKFFLNILADIFFLTSSSLHLSFSSINHVVASLAVFKFQK